MKPACALLPLLTLAAACTQPAPGPRSYGDDALPSAETTAFQQVDARLRYGGARIERDARNCAVYRGTAPDGTVRTEPLRDPAGQPICARP